MSFIDEVYCICCANLFIYIPDNSNFNDIVTKNIRCFSQWFIHEFGMYPTVLMDGTEGSINIITLESICPDSLERIKRSFEKDGFTEILERLICRKEVMDTLKNKEEKVNVKLILFSKERENKGMLVVVVYKFFCLAGINKLV